MKFCGKDEEKLKEMQAMNKFLSKLLEGFAEREDAGTLGILAGADKVMNNTDTILDWVKSRIRELEENDKEKTERFINFFKGINNLYDEFMKAELEEEVCEDD